MRAIWLEDRRLELRYDLPLPAVPEGEALVRVTLAGVCNTDLELVKGYYPFAGIPGHEFVGRVEQADSAPALVGCRVVGEINAVCGACRHCRAGRTSHCDRRTVLGIVNRHGAFAEYLVLPVGNLHEVPDAMPDEVAVFTEPVAAAFRILEQIDIAATDVVVVLGDGKLGQVIAQVLQRTGCDLVVVGRHSAKLARLSARGIRTTESGTLPPRTVDVVVECTGSPEGFARATSLLRPRGTLVLKSTYAGATSVAMSPLVVDEITIIGSRCGPFAPALEALASRVLDVLPLIDYRLPLARGLEAFARAAAPGTLKVLVEP